MIIRGVVKVTVGIPLIICYYATNMLYLFDKSLSN